MNKLLRQATVLLDARQKVYLGDWDYISDPLDDFDTACNVIEGYQDLIRRIITVVGQGTLYAPTTVSNMEFTFEGEDLINQLGMVITEAKASVPKEKAHE